MLNTELKILEVLWEIGPMTASELYKILQKKLGWNKSTTYTLLNRCIEKGIIERIEPNFICKPLLKRDEVQRKGALDLISKLFHNSKMEFVQTFLKKENLTDEEISELENWIQKWK